MKIAYFSMHEFEKEFIEQANSKHQHQIKYFSTSLNAQTAKLAQGFDVVTAFVSDQLNQATLSELKKLGIQLIALRSAGFNHVDLVSAEQLELPVVRVPEYSPYSVAEHAVALLLSLNRKIFRSYNRVRELNFSLDGLVGFDLNKKIVGVVGTGKIGSVFCKIMHGFGCKILAYDISPNQKLVKNYQVEYVDLPQLFKQADIISLHLPLTPSSKHLVNQQAFSLIKPSSVIINTSRGALIDTPALIKALKKAKLAGAALDVYEEEEGIFFHDLSNKVLQDDQLARLLTFSNVIVTAHQAFLTKEALTNIAETTLQNISSFEKQKILVNEVHAQRHVAK